jgi:hypothetical protein
MRSFAITLLVLLALACPVLVAGCGSDDVSFDAAVAQAADRTAAVDGMRVAITTRVAGQEIHGTGFQDVRGRKAEIHMDIPGAGRVDTVVDDLVMYLRLPEQLRGALPGDQEWIRVDLRKALSGAGIDLDAMTGMTGTDPAAQLQQLKATSDIEKVGTEDVRGVSTTHYRGTIDLHEVPDVVPADQRETARRSIDKLLEQTGGDGTIPVELWVDGDDRVRRLRETIPNEQAGDMEMTMELYDFDAREQVEIPDAGDTVDLTDEAASALP